MSQLTVVYFMTAVLIAIATLSISIVFYFQTRNKLILFYNIFSINIAYSCIMSFITRYLVVNSQDFFDKNLDLVRLLNVPPFTLLIFTIPLFIQSFIEFRFSRHYNVFFGTLSVFFIVMDVFILKFKHPLFSDVVYVFIIISIFYSFFIGLLFYKKITDDKKRKLFRNILILFAILIPGYIVDIIFDMKLLSLFEHYPNFMWFYPILYSVQAVVITVSLVRYIDFNHKIEIDEKYSNIDIYKEYDVTEREKEIILLILKGYSNLKIGDTLFISVNTVKKHIYNLFKKMDVQNRFELIHKITKS